MKERDEQIRKYEEAFYQTILQNSDLKKFIPQYFGESEIPDKCNVWQDLTFGSKDMIVELKPGSLVGVLAPKSIREEFKDKEGPGLTEKVS